MPYDRQLADELRHALEGRPGIQERAMFGGLCWLLNGNMICGVEVLKPALADGSIWLQNSRAPCRPNSPALGCPEVMRSAWRSTPQALALAVDLVTDWTIDRPGNAVSAYATNSDNTPSWLNFKSVIWKSAPPPDFGSRIEFVAEFLGWRLEYTCEVVEFEPGAIFAMRCPFPMETTYTWRAAGLASRRKAPPDGRRSGP